MADVCGTGLGNFPAPGDPNLDSLILSAQSAQNGISVTWTYPSINPHAVAYTKLYRYTANDSAEAIALGPIIVAGTSYLDSVDVVIGTTYYYWIKMVSVNSTVGALIGPASAVMQPRAEVIIDLLTAKIANSELAGDLKTRIDQIDLFSTNLTAETNNRVNQDSALSLLVAAVQGTLADVDTLVQSEIINRVVGDSALVDQVNVIATVSNGNSALIATEQTARADADSAMASQITTLEASDVTQSASISTLQTVTTGVDGLTAQFMVKSDVAGYVSGFGLYNDGVTSDFIIHADNFAVGTPSTQAADGTHIAYPFIIGSVNGQTQIVLNANTIIQEGTILNAMVGDLQSTIYEHTVGTSHAGWRATKAGGIEASAITIYASDGTVILDAGGLGGAQGSKLAGIADNADVSPTTLDGLDATAASKLNGISPNAQVNPANLSDLDASASSKLTGIAAGAQVNAPTIGCRINAINFTETNAGEIYVHGYNSLGVAADVDGAVNYAGQSYIVPKGYSGMYGHHDGWLVIDISGAATLPNGVGLSDRSVCYKDGAQWKFDNNSATPQNFTPTANHIIIGAVSFVGPENVLSANVWSEGQNLGQVSGFGSIDQITATNISTYIASLAVDTLQIADNAVTVEGYNRYPTGTGTGNSPTVSVTMADCPSGVRTVFYVNSFVSDDGSNPSAYDILIKIYEDGVLKDTYLHYLYSYGTDLVSVTRVASSTSDVMCTAWCYDHATSTYTSASFVTITGTYAKK